MGQGMRKNPLQISVRRVDAVEAVEGFAGVEQVVKSEGFEKAADAGTLDRAINNDRSVNVPVVVADADAKRRAFRARLALAREKGFDPAIGYRRREIRIKDRFQAAFLMVVYPSGWGMALRRPIAAYGSMLRWVMRASIHPTALGGFTIDGPYFRRRSRVGQFFDRFFHWLGA